MIDRGRAQQDVVDEAYDLPEPVTAGVLGEERAGEDARRSADQGCDQGHEQAAGDRVEQTAVTAGGGVICVNIATLIAPSPLKSSVPSTSASQSRPNAVATNASTITSRWVSRRRW